MNETVAFTAANRFGMGPRPGELAAVARNPHGWLKAQITKLQDLPEELQGLPSAADRVLEMNNALRQGGPENFMKTIRRLARRHAVAEIGLRAQAMAASDEPFRERLVKFWSNHFTVSWRSPQVIAIAPAYEREAIRPHIFGRFEDLLLAVVKHPAMLLYLDNATSFGPNSLVGRRRGLGLNENLAREILELHTLGVNGGYGQGDVIALAKILTGWSHGALRKRGPHDGRFRFYDIGHEPGSKTFLGNSYRHNGVAEGEAALRFLAHHPSTARFIATKLVRHFVADEPPPTAVRTIERAFLDSGGDLAAVSRALIDLPEAWAEPLAKVKTPYELVISTLRAFQFENVPPKKLLGSLHELGQFPFRAPSPAGWPDRAHDWIAPEALMRRIEWTRAVAARLPRRSGALALARHTIAPVASKNTLSWVRRAPSEEEGIALVLASTEFQRR